VTPYPRTVSTRPFAYAAGTNFFFFASLNSFVLLPLYIQQRGGTAAEIGIIMGMYSASAIFCQPLVGTWVDRIGRRPFMLLGVSLAALSSVAFAASAYTWHFVLLRLLQGVAFSAFFVANYTLIVALASPEHRGYVLGIFGVSGLLSTALAPLAGEWVIRWFGYRAFFLEAAALAAVALVMALGIRGPETATAPPGPRAHGILPELGDIFRLHMALALFFGAGTGTIFTFLPTFAERLGVTNLSLFYTGYAGSAMLVRAVGGHLIDTLGRRAVIVPSMLVQATASAILTALALLVDRPAAVPLLPFLLLAGVLAGGAHGFLFPALSALVMDLTHESRRGQAVGIYSSTILSGSALGSMTFGYVIHSLGYGAMFGVLTLLLAGGFAASLRLPRG
jgi:MFS family permease